MIVELKTRRYFDCPNGCKHRFEVEHLLTPGDPCSATEAFPTRSAGPWFCDVCGQGWDLEYTEDMIAVTPTPGPGGKKFTHTVVLELPPQAKPVCFKVRGIRFAEAIDEESVRFFYEENTCPLNFLRSIVEISVGEDDDPHGLFSVVEVCK